MSAAARLGAFAAGLAVAFVASFGLGRAVGPVGDTDEPAHGHDGTEVTTTTGPVHGGHGGHGDHDGHGEGAGT